MKTIRRRSRGGRKSGADDSPFAKRQKTGHFAGDPQDENPDLELLKTGAFSDATVICDGKEIKVHKAILCPRSHFFRAALAGNFSEAVKGEVNVEEFTYQQVQVTIHFAYAGEIEGEENLKMADFVDLIRLGDYFLVDGMVDHFSQRLWARLEPQIIASSKSFAYPLGFKVQVTDNAYNGVQHPSAVLESATDFSDEFRAAVSTAYEPDGCIIARRILTDFTFIARGALLGMPMVQGLNEGYPEFGSDVFTVMNKGLQSAFLIKEKPVQLSATSCKSCTGCNRNWRFDKWPVLFDPMSLELAPTKAYCQDCSGKGTSLRFVQYGD